MPRRPLLLLAASFGALAGALLGARPSLAEPLPAGAVALPCPTDRIDVGQPAWRWALDDGFFGDEAAGGRSFSWMGRQATVLLVLGDEAPEALELTVRSAAEGRRLSAILDGHPLGDEPVPVRWSEVRWEVPAELSAAGVHLLELRASGVSRRPPDPRELGVAIDDLRLDGAGTCAAEPRRLGPEALSVELPPGGFLVVRGLLPPAAAVEVGIEGREEAAGAGRLRLHALSGARRAGPLRLERRPGDEPREAAAPVFGASVPARVCCRNPSVLALRNTGDEAVIVTSWGVREEGGSGDWRRACGLLPWELAAGGLLLVTAVLALRRRWRAPLGRYAPWLDLVVVVAVAFALRALFLQLYPEIGRAGDTYEYVLRARKLVGGRASFLSSTAWHAWQTWLRPPGFYLFLAGVLGPLGGTLLSVTWWNAAFSSVAAGATYWTGYTLFGRGAGLVAGLFFATYLEAVVTVSRVLSEPLYTVLLMPGLALLAGASRRPSWRLAGLAGLALGAATLVRSAPLVYVPAASLLLLAVHGPRRGWRSALALTGGMALLVVPWSVRNTVVRGTVTGIDDLAVINLLQVQPDERFVPHEDLDLATEEGARVYYSRLQRANTGARLARQGGAVLARNLRHKILHPVETTATIARNLGVYFSPYRSLFFLSIQREPDRCRVILLTDAMNLQYLVLLGLAGWGLVTRLRHRWTWPLAFWPILNVAVLVVFFHAETKYRLPVLPVLMVFAGPAVLDLARAVRAVGRRSAA